MSAPVPRTTYEIQGRRSSNGVRLVTEPNRTAALAIAAGMAADGFTAWVFETTRSPGGKRYSLITTVPPAPT